MVARCFRNDSAGKLQIPSSKLQRISKPQTSTRCPGWPPHRSGLGLELEIWSFSGAWCLGLGALVRAAFHRKQRGTNLPNAAATGEFQWRHRRVDLGCGIVGESRRRKLFLRLIVSAAAFHVEQIAVLE